MPANIQLVEFAVGLPIALLISYLIALAMRRVFRSRLPLSLPVMILTSVVGTAIGLFIAGWFISGLRLWMPTTLLIAFGSSILVTFLVSTLFAGLRRDPGEVDVAALLAAGESDRVELKETARWNVREDKKDPRMEQVVAKTVAAFLNSGGGTLVVGANDAGEALGLDRDLATLRVADVDRFELWLRDLLSTLLGRNAAALPIVRFPAAPNGKVVCVIVCPPSPRPVFMTHAKDGSSTELWVRVGNSTRSFAVDEAVEYVSRHWGGRRTWQRSADPKHPAT
ncbi:AlbA family DNA-binding domain-containing protein [Microbacterium sp. bgisy207]|uniref:AlbA family DNA-binding domain-containing protein n=1 Tax=Microbacterium sp. bgisy207 TaxID=3413800 RepID=UPI003EC10FBB